MSRNRIEGREVIAVRHCLQTFIILPEHREIFFSLCTVPPEHLSSVGTHLLHFTWFGPWWLEKAKVVIRFLLPAMLESIYLVQTCLFFFLQLFTRLEGTFLFSFCKMEFHQKGKRQAVCQVRVHIFQGRQSIEGRKKWPRRLTFGSWGSCGSKEVFIALSLSYLFLLSARPNFGSTTTRPKVFRYGMPMKVFFFLFLALPKEGR